MKKERFKGFLAGVFATVMVLALGTTAFATLKNVQASLTYKNISVTLDGTKLSLKDANGNSVEPFMYNGTNYLPARALAEALGLNVAWNGSTNTVVLTTPGTTASGSYSRTNPAPANITQSITIEDYSYGTYTASMTVTDILRGAEAWNRISAANMFNESAPAGYEYILAKVKVTIDKNTKDASVTLGQYDFKAYSSTNSAYDDPAVVEPDPAFSGDAFAGGSIEGWMAWQVAQNDTAPKMVFGQKYDGTGGIWFSLAE